MLTTYGYGEDALTYWAFRFRFDAILKQLDDRSKEEDCILFYRPSFGRGGTSKTLFGEFDAILITPLRLYLIESKWDGSNELRDGSLSAGQAFRHFCFNWIAMNWNGLTPFSKFVESRRDDFIEAVLAYVNKELTDVRIDIESAASMGLRELPDPDSKVGRHMQHILRLAREKVRDFQVHDVVLILLADEKKVPKGEFVEFKKVIINYPSFTEAIGDDESGLNIDFFDMNSPK